MNQWVITQTSQLVTNQVNHTGPPVRPPAWSNHVCRLRPTQSHMGRSRVSAHDQADRLY
jgi:hypothetical protein